MGFTFVDRILAIDTEHARGLLRRLDGAPPLPPWLVVEAVGQLAAWIAIRRTDFHSRPVAALVGEVQVTDACVTGTLELEARIDRFDGRAILYSGSARAAGSEIAALSRGVGPMLPMEAFDDPAAVRQRFDTLCAPQPPPVTAGGDIARPVLAAVELGTGSARAQLRVPEKAPFFAEHFPRRPVYPATLLVDAISQLGMIVAEAALGLAPPLVRLVRLADLKVRAFSPPGQLIEIVAESRPSGIDVARVGVAASAEGKRVATCVVEYRSAPAGAR